MVSLARQVMPQLIGEGLPLGLLTGGDEENDALHRQVGPSLIDTLTDAAGGVVDGDREILIV